MVIPPQLLATLPKALAYIFGYMALSKGADMASGQYLQSKQRGLEEKKLDAMIKAMMNKQEVEERMYKEMKSERGQQREYLAAMRQGDREHEMSTMLLKDMMGSEDRNTALMMSMIGNMAQPSQGRFPQVPIPYAQLTQI